MKPVKIEVKGKDVVIYGFSEIDEAAKGQLYEAVSQDFVVRGALMPDAHKGYSLPIGGVVACKDVIVPAYVGYDIGCGMCAFQLKGIGVDEVRRNADKIFSMIYRRIPVGKNHHKDDQEWHGWTENGVSDWFFNNFYERNGLRQLGTLGGGNHFIEIGWDKKGDKSVWIVIHSGSRGIGHNTGTYYMRKAAVENTDKQRYADEFEAKNQDFKEHKPDKFEKAKEEFIYRRVRARRGNDEGHHGLRVDSKLGEDYIMDMNVCLEFALKNRMNMGNQIIEILEQVLEHDVDVVEVINRNHNHAELKDGLWIHRKGATHAEDGMKGVIPGNMKDGSFIVVGKGNEDGLCSSSHGAGRLFSRTKAKAVLDIHKFKTEMSDITAKVNKSTLDESSGAYKDIHMVMDNQEDLVDVVAHIVPVINIKA
jgi:tRNA-splicing ligase RtcB